MNSQEMKFINEHLGANLRFLRKKANYTQKQLAEKLKCNQSTISLYENGKIPVLDDIVAMCGIFEIGIQELLYSDLEKPESRKKDKFFPNLFDYSAILKIGSNTYYSYYLDETKENKKPRIKELRLDFLKENLVNVTFCGQNKVRIKCQIHFDGSYAYIAGHDYDKDLYVYITFYYHRNSLNSIYYGGIGLLETRDCYRLPTCRFCVMSINPISNGYFDTLKNILLLKVAGSAESKLSEKTTSNECTIRLTKKKDKEAFEWLIDHGIIVPRNENL